MVPSPPRNSDLYTTGGHINPIGYFYIAHSLTDAGFEKVEPHIDKRKRSGVAQLLWSLPIKFFAALSWRREVKRFHTIDKENAPFVRAMNSRDLLLGRTVIVAAVKPAAQWAALLFLGISKYSPMSDNSKQQIAEVYEKHRAAANTTTSMATDVTRAYIELIGKGKKILEVGCRAGNLTQFHIEGNGRGR